MHKVTAMIIPAVIHKTPKTYINMCDFNSLKGPMQLPSLHEDGLPEGPQQLTV